MCLRFVNEATHDASLISSSWGARGCNRQTQQRKDALFLPAQHLPWSPRGAIAGKREKRDAGRWRRCCAGAPMVGVTVANPGVPDHFPSMHELVPLSKIGAETGRSPRCPIAWSQNMVKPCEGPVRFADRTARIGTRKSPRYGVMSGNVHPMPDRCMQGPRRLPEIVGPEISQARQGSKKSKRTFPAPPPWIPSSSHVRQTEHLSARAWK